MAASALIGRLGRAFGESEAARRHTPFSPQHVRSSVLDRRVLILLDVFNAIFAVSRSAIMPRKRRSSRKNNSNAENQPPAPPDHKSGPNDPQIPQVCVEKMCTASSAVNAIYLIKPVVQKRHFIMIFIFSRKIMFRHALILDS
jgi:hypothetical protein